MQHKYLTNDRDDILTERAQCQEEGLDAAELDGEFARLLEVDLAVPENQLAAQALLDKTVTLPLVSNYSFIEPNGIDEIRAQRPLSSTPATSLNLSSEEMLDRVHGAWTGRCIGCLLGKPVEGWKRDQLWPVLKDAGKWPLADFIRSADVSDDFRAANFGPDYWLNAPFIERVNCMVEDDDTNYTTTGLAILKQYGPDFTPADVATFWMMNIPILHTFTAERAAIRNLSMQIAPPDSAMYRNPYREWIGAQIRADFWGYVSAGNPALAAEFAWRDASVSHIKNGIYGEMWAAAMVAAAFGTEDVRDVIYAGLAQIPAKCRLANYVEDVLEWHEIDVDYDTAVYRIHEMWDEKSAHGWCHTISNAMIVAVGLLYGEGDFAKSICRAVQACFDTDCNGATVGSIIGAMHGRKALPSDWADVINDTLETGVSGYYKVSLSDMAKETITLQAVVN